MRGFRIGLCGLSLVFLLGTVFISVAGAVDMAATAVPTDRAQSALDRALEHYRDGRLGEAAGLLRGFLVSYPDSILTDKVYRTLAAIHADLDDPQLALDYLEKIPAADRLPVDRLLQGRLQIRSGAVGPGVVSLKSLSAAELSLPERQQRALLLAAGLAELEQPQPALYFLYQAFMTEGRFAPDEVLHRMQLLMDAQMSSTDLSEAVFMYHDTPVAQLAMLKLGWRALDEGNKDLARQWVVRVLEGPPNFAYRDEALSLHAQLTDPNQLQRAIGVLLPLSGRYAAFGKLVQRGMEQAREDFRPAVPVRFLYRDTAGDADTAARQTAELAIGERVLGIAGPLVGNAASAAAPRAALEQIPLLTLSQKEDLAVTSPYVFRDSLTIRLQVETLIDYAMKELGMHSFGILYPETRQGQMMADQFELELEKRGGELVQRQDYSPDQTDFRREIRLLQGLDPNAPDEENSTTAESSVIAEEEKPPPFDALFVPDYADRISLVAPQLPFYGLEGVQLLGTNGWNDPQLLKAAGKFVEGAVFVDGFFRHSPYSFVQEFVEKYFAKYGEDPTILAAQGYDAAGILLTLLNDPRVNTRASLRWALSQMPIFPGVTGATHFDFQGEAVKTLFILQIRDGIIEQVN